MKNAAIYSRVSTDDQEREGTSLQTQLDACLKYCQDKGYEVVYRFSEACSGLTLERTKLNELRDVVRNEEVDVVVVYCLDRLSRDPTHGVILAQELEKHHVRLEAVTEDVDNSELGKLISYIRGFASKLEAEKIRERTMRGKKARAEQGRMMGGGFAKLYGYDYIKVAEENGGRRVINETEAKWVRKIYHWLVNEGMSTTAITNRLRALAAPTKMGKYWTKQSVLSILKNPAYTGSTYAFTTANHRQFSRPRSEWIEIPGVTPEIIEKSLFESAQKQLQVNRDKATRNRKRKYLLHGHLGCKKCRRAYYAYFSSTYVKGKRYEKRRYRCSGSMRMIEPVNQCHNKSWSADALEALVWKQIENVLDNPELILAEMEKQHRDSNQLGVLEDELRQIERQLKALDCDQEQLLHWALKGFPERTVITENNRINEKRKNLNARKAELETEIKGVQKATGSLPKIEHFYQLARARLTSLDFEAKRMALEMLDIRVWLDGHNVDITGFIPVSEDVIVTTQSSQYSCPRKVIFYLTPALLLGDLGHHL